MSATPSTRRRSRRVTTMALTAVPFAALGVLALPSAGEAATLRASTTIKDASGRPLGTVRFTVYRDKTVVQAHVALPTTAARNAFHGFHIHANDKPENGSGCVADPAKPPATWFVSADGHLADVGTTHGGHAGDLPSLLVNADGTADMAFTTGRFDVGDLRNRVVIVHANADNFGNIPVGDKPDQYRPNSADATTKTGATGNAGDRLGCGVVRIDR